MFRLLAWVFSGRSQDDDSKIKALHEQINKLEQQLMQSRDGDSQATAKSSEKNAQKDVEPTNCFKKKGRVTDIRGDHIVIDKMYFVPKAMLQSCTGSEKVEKNTGLSFLAYHKCDEISGESTVKVVKILAVIDENWSTDGLAVNDSVGWEQAAIKPFTGDTDGGAGGNIEGGNDTVYYQGNQRREPGKVIEKDGNMITIETDAGAPISVDLDKTRMSFVPKLGDYVTLDCLVQMDRDYVDYKGEVLDVLAIEPSRTVNGDGTISTHAPEGGEIFTASGKYIYQSECLVGGYRPSVGDTVAFRAVENEHVQMRCISVQLVKLAEKRNNDSGGRTLAMRPKRPNDGERPLNRETNGNGNRDHGEAEQGNVKRPISIVGDFEVNFQNLDDTIVRTVKLKNESKVRHKIMFAKPAMVRGNHLVSLKSPSEASQLMLFPGETVEYVFSISGDSFFGRHRETWTWEFGKFKISRTFYIRIGDEARNATDGGRDSDGEGASVYAPFNKKVQFLQQKLAALNVQREHKTACFVPGERLDRANNFVAFAIPNYAVPQDLLDLVLTTESSKEFLQHMERPPYCINEPLSPRNYGRLFDLFIFLEEIHQFIMFRRHDMERGHFTREENFLALHVSNIAEARPSLMVGDVANATAPWSEETAGKAPPIYQGVIHKVLQNRVLLKFEPSFQSRYNGESYRLTFTFARGVYRKQHYAVERVRSCMGPEYLFPTTIELREPSLNVHLNEHDELVLVKGDTTEVVIPWQNPNLNQYQKTAIANVLRSEARPMPYMIFGPPGTGKTITTIELIHQLALHSPDCRLIVATPSNSAAYLITERLVQAGVLKAGDFIRLVSSNQVERESIPEHLAPYCATVEIGEDRNTKGEVLTTESGLRMKFQAKHIGRHRVTISTCSSMGVLMHLRFPPNHFTHVIVDEAGQALEPETLIPITLINRQVGSVTLVGDPKQLGPIVLSFTVLRYGYDMSLMERLVNTARPYAVDRERFGRTQGYDPRLVTKLRLNYRSTPALLALYSEMFYDSHLLPCQSAIEADHGALYTTLHDILGVQRRTANYGYFFCGIDGTNKQSPDSPSWFNPAEACMVHKIVERLYRKGYKPDEMGIISPYAMQVKVIRRIFQTAQLDCPKVGTVEEFQGQERRIIVVSTVRSSRACLPEDKEAVLGFMSTPRRVNVAISRSREALVVVGNPHLLALDHLWQQLIQRAVTNKTYVGCMLPTTILSDRTEMDEMDDEPEA